MIHHQLTDIYTKTPHNSELQISQIQSEGGLQPSTINISVVEKSPTINENKTHNQIVLSKSSQCYKNQSSSCIKSTSFLHKQYWKRVIEPMTSGLRLHVIKVNF